VIQLLLGIIVGPAVLGLAHPDTIVNGLADLGFFSDVLAGYELDLLRIRGRPLRLAAVGWVLSLAWPRMVSAWSRPGWPATRSSSASPSQQLPLGPPAVLRDAGAQDAVRFVLPGRRHRR